MTKRPALVLCMLLLCLDGQLHRIHAARVEVGHRGAIGADTAESGESDNKAHKHKQKLGKKLAMMSKSVNGLNHQARMLEKAEYEMKGFDEQSDTPPSPTAKCTKDYGNYYVAGDDNSFGCWVTDAVLAFQLLITFTAFAASLKRINLGLEMSRTWYTLSLFCLFVSVAAATYYHKDSANEPKTKTAQNVWNVVALFLLLHGSASFCLALAMVSKVDNTVRSKVMYMVAFVLGGVVGGIEFYTDLGFAVAAGLGAGIPAIVVSLAAGYRASRFGRYDIVGGLALAFVLAVAGFAGQVALAGKCGTSCPVDCPFSDPPKFNHNAFLHVVQLLEKVVMAATMWKLFQLIEDDVSPKMGEEEPQLSETALNI